MMDYHKDIHLVPLIELDEGRQMEVLKIRNEDSVRKWMYTDHIIGENEHLNWLNRLKHDATQIIFAVLDDKNTPLGVVSVIAIDQLHKKANLAYYLTEKSRGGLGTALEYAIINYIFDGLNIEKLNCETLEGNKTVVHLNKKFFFQEEGFIHSNIIKNGKRVGVRFLGLTKENWLANRTLFAKKYHNVLSKFCISIRLGRIELD